MSTNTSNNQRIAKNTLLLYVRMAFSLLVTLYTSRVVLNALGVVDYGVYNVVAGFVSMFAFLNVALNSSIQRYFNYENGKSGAEGFQKVYVTAIFIQVIIAILAVLLCETIGLWYFENKLVIPADRLDAARVLFHVSVASMFLVVMQVPYSSAILAKEKMDYYALVGIIDVILKLAVVFIIDVTPFDKLESYAWLLAIVAVIDFLLYYFYSRIKFKELRFHFKFYPDLFGSMLRFSGWSAFGGFSQVVRHQGVNIVLNIFFGPVVNAARGISYQVKSSLIGFVGNITMASRPQMTEAYAAANQERSIRLMNSTSKLCFLLLLMMALPISVEIDFVLDLWLNHTVPDHTAVFTILVLASTMVDILQTPIGIIVNATGQIGKYNFYSSVIGLTILPIAYVVLKLGAEPELVYLMSFFVSVAIQIACVVIMSQLIRYSKREYMLKVVMPLILVVLLSCVFPVLVHFIMNPGFLRFITVCVVSVVTVALSGYFLSFDKKEKDMVLGFVKKVTNRMCKEDK